MPLVWDSIVSRTLRKSIFTILFCLFFPQFNRNFILPRFFIGLLFCVGSQFALNCTVICYLSILMFLVCGSDDWEMHVWAWRIVFVSNLLGSIVTIFVFAMSEAMGNLYALHLFNSMVQLLWWVNFTMCLTRSPMFVREATSSSVRSSPVWTNGKSEESSTSSASKNLRAYAVVVDAIGRCASEHDVKKFPTLCHTCKVVRPLRAKHCKMLNRCVRRVSNQKYHRSTGACRYHDKPPLFSSLNQMSLTQNHLFNLLVSYMYGLICMCISCHGVCRWFFAFIQFTMSYSSTISGE